MFGTRIKELRISLKMNQIEFGKALNATKQSVSNWENGNILPSVDMLLRIAQTYHVSTDFLLGFKESRCLDVSGLTNQQIAHLQQIIDDLRSK